MGFIGRLLSRYRPRWEEAWQAFPGAIGDDPAQWSVDLGAIGAAPVTDLPVRLDVEVAYRALADGTPADEAELARIEGAVRAAATAHGGAYIGRVAGAGRCRLTAHLPAEPQPSVTVSGATVTTAYDPHWAYVRDTLAPDERQQQVLSDLAVLGLLSVQGDPLATPRDVAHLAYFAAQEPAEEAAADLRADGFSAIVERDDEGEFALTALRRDPVAPPRVHELTWAVKETVERHGGLYDGWDCEVARAA